MKERLTLSLENNRIKLKNIEYKITLLNLEYMDLLDMDENNRHLNKLEAELNYLERQQDIIVRTIRDKKRQLKELNINM